MVYSQLRKLSRFALAACAVSFGVATMVAQAPSSAAPAGNNPSRFDVFLGYSYLGVHDGDAINTGGMTTDGKYSSIDLGAIGSGAYYFNRHFGAEAIFAAHPDGNNDSFYSISGGPIFRFPMTNFTLFVHALAGGGKLAGPNTVIETPNGIFAFSNPSKWGPTLTAGGGMDYDLPFFGRHLAYRLFQADYRYIHTNFGPFASATAPITGTNMNVTVATGGRANLNAVELSTGLLFRFGGILPPAAVVYSCSAAPATVFPGDPVTVTGTALNLNPKRTAVYSWAMEGGAVSGTNEIANVDTRALAPGNYTVKGHVSQGKKPGDMADCSAEFTVRAIEPPTVSCSANPSTVRPGDSATITANGVSPQNRPLTYSYSSSAGSVSGTTSTATLNTAGAAPGPIMVTANVVDDKGQTASCTATVTVVAPVVAPPPAPKTSSLCSITFDRDHARPTRVDNEAKACLDDVALNLQRASDARLAVTGNATAKEKAVRDRMVKHHARHVVDPAALRAVNTKDYLVTEKGIDAGRISVYTGTEDSTATTTTLIPTGATLDTTGITPVDESAVKAIPRHSLPARHHAAGRGASSEEGRHHRAAKASSEAGSTASEAGTATENAGTSAVNATKKAGKATGHAIKHAAKKTADTVK